MALGPRPDSARLGSLPDSARYLDRRGGGPLDHHQWWKANHALRADDWGVAEHETGLRAIELAGGYDGVDITNVASLEVLMRRVQLVEYAYSDRRGSGKKGNGKDWYPKGGNWYGKDWYDDAGESKGKGGLPPHMMKFQAARAANLGLIGGGKASGGGTAIESQRQWKSPV